MTPETVRCMEEINTFPPGAAPCLIRMEYTDTELFSGVLTLSLETVQGEYRVCFPRTAAYLSRIEAYTSVRSDEVYNGTCIREYTKSRFIDLMNEMTFAGQVENYRHYGVYTEGTVFDIASFTEPEITKIHSKE
ncbi:MAG: hypothetical protein IJ334_01365 [Clostridia bacterium]|nr:hypothetical protein [Clostridia bacterium]